MGEDVILYTLYVILYTLGYGGGGQGGARGGEEGMGSKGGRPGSGRHATPDRPGEGLGCQVQIGKYATREEVLEGGDDVCSICQETMQARATGRSPSRGRAAAARRMIDPRAVPPSVGRLRLSSTSATTSSAR